MAQAQAPRRPAPADTSVRPTIDTARAARRDTTVVVTDSLRRRDLETTVTYSAQDSIVMDVDTRLTRMYGKANVKYGQISVDADVIELDYRTNVVYARGTKDSTGRLRNTPVFADGPEKYTTDEMRYNFKSKRAIITGIITTQGDGNIRGERVKKDPEDNMYIQNAIYTTCNLKHPHYFISAPKIKLVNKKSIVTGPFNLVIADIPTPLGFAFGFFPITKQKPNGVSGIIVPTYGEEPQARGFFLRNGGYYWALNENISIAFLGEIYSRGGWGLNVQSTYKKRYRFDGSFGLRFNDRTVENTDATFSSGQDFWIDWSHRPVARGLSSFSASVNAGSSRFNRRNSFDPQAYLSNTFRSAISYAVTFRGTPFRMAINANHDQNVNTGVVNLLLPSVTFNMNRIFPFKPETGGGKGWWETINVGFDFTGGAQFSNQPTGAGSFPFQLARPRTALGDFVRTPVSVADTVIPFNPFDQTILSQLLKRAQIGGSYTVPVSASLKFLRFFSFNPSINFQGFVYPQRLDYQQKLDGSVVVDTIRGLANAYTFSSSASLTTRIFGTYNFGVDRALQSIRHTIIPSVSLAYSPNFADPRFNAFQFVRDQNGRFVPVSRFQGFRYGAPSAGQSGSLNFSLNNTLEAKVRNKADTTGKAKTQKISLLNALNLTGGYDFLRDSLRLSTLNLSANTRLLKTLDINFGATFDPYTYLPDARNPTGPGLRVNRYLLQSTGQLASLQSANLAIGTSFKPGGNKKTDSAQKGRVDKAEGTPEEKAKVLNNPALYVDFNIPWTFNVSYNLAYVRPGLAAAQVTQTVQFNGDVKLTDKWKIGFNSGFDVQQRNITFTQVNIYRDLHCWEMRFDWIPFGQRQSYAFTINVKSALLRDLRLQRQRSWYDRSVDLQR